jgi:hypothetical protein
VEFLDDALLARLNGPCSVAEYVDGAPDPAVDLVTPFSVDCASLWRELFGNRFGHYNAAATAAAALKRQRTPGVFRGATLGVLAAARLAVVAARRMAGQARGSGPVVQTGAGTAAGALWNKSMRNFQKRSRRNIPGVTQTRARPGAPFLKPAGVHLGARRGAQAQPLACTLSYSPKVAIMGEGCPANNCRILTGPHRCADAELVVVPDLALLHDVDALAANVDLVVSFLYVVSLGLDITTKTQLAAVQGVPRRLSPHHCVRHVPAHGEEVAFCVGARLRLEQEDVHRALRRIARVPESNFTVSTASTAASGEIFFGDIRDVVAWACSARRARNEIGPKAFVADGRAMPA